MEAVVVEVTEEAAAVGNPAAAVDLEVVVEVMEEAAVAGNQEEEEVSAAVDSAVVVAVDLEAAAVPLRSSK